jgi:hypothetical protein
MWSDQGALRRFLLEKASPVTYYDAYITSAHDVGGFDQHADQAGGTAPVRSPLFPGGTEAFFAIRDAAKSMEVDGIQIDWGSWAILMTRDEIIAFLARIYGPPGHYEAQHAGTLQHLADKMQALRDFVLGLPPGERFAVVAEEF